MWAIDAHFLKENKTKEKSGCRQLTVTLYNISYIEKLIQVFKGCEF